MRAVAARLNLSLSILRRRGGRLVERSHWSIAQPHDGPVPRRDLPRQVAGGIRLRSQIHEVSQVDHGLRRDGWKVTLVELTFNSGPNPALA